MAIRTFWISLLLSAGCNLAFPDPLFCQDAPPPAKEAPAAPAESSEEALRKASQNPIASLISVPIQNSNYNMKKGWYITLQPILTANWRATGGNTWTVPFGGGVGRIMKFGAQPVNLAAQIYAKPIRPAGTSTWSMRLAIAFLFPKLTPQEEEMMMREKLKQLETQKTQKK